MTKEQFADEYVAASHSPVDIDDAYDRMLDETYPDLTVAGMPFNTSYALRELDETAYDCGRNDWVDGELKDDNLVEIGGYYYDMDATAEHQEILDTLEGIFVVEAVAEDFRVGRYTHHELDGKPTRDDFDTADEYREALDDWQESCEEVEGWSWHEEGEPLNGPFDCEEDAWVDAAGL